MPGLAPIGGDGQLSMTAAGPIGHFRKLAARIVAGKRYVEIAMGRVRMATGQCADCVDDEVWIDIKGDLVRAVVRLRSDSHSRLPGRSRIVAAGNEDSIVGMKAERPKLHWIPRYGIGHCSGGIQKGRLVVQEFRRHKSHENMTSVVERGDRIGSAFVKRRRKRDGTMLPGCATIGRRCDAYAGIAGRQQRVVHVGDYHVVGIKWIHRHGWHLLNAWVTRYRDVLLLGLLSSEEISFGRRQLLAGHYL